MEDSLHLFGMTVMTNSFFKKVHRVSSNSPSWTRAWHSSAPACFSFFLLLSQAVAFLPERSKLGLWIFTWAPKQASLIPAHAHTVCAGNLNSDRKSSLRYSLKAQNLIIFKEKGNIWGTSVKSTLKLYQYKLLKCKLLSYNYDCPYKCTLFQRKFDLRVQEAGKIK